MYLNGDNKNVGSTLMFVLNEEWRGELLNNLSSLTDRLQESKLFKKQLRFLKFILYLVSSAAMGSSKSKVSKTQIRPPVSNTVKRVCLDGSFLQLMMGKWHTVN